MGHDNGDHASSGEQQKGNSDHEPRREDLHSEASEVGPVRSAGLEQHRQEDQDFDGELRIDDAIPAEVVEEITRQGRAEMLALVQEAHAGPLPPAAEFGRYDEILPGAADRILKMAEKDIELQEKQVAGNVEIQSAIASSIRSAARRADSQLWAYLVLSIAIVAVACILAWNGKDVPAVFAIVVASASGFMVYKSNKESQSVYPQSGKDNEQR